MLIFGKHTARRNPPPEHIYCAYSELCIAEVKRESELEEVEIDMGLIAQTLESNSMDEYVLTEPAHHVGDDVAGWHNDVPAGKSIIKLKHPHGENTVFKRLNELSDKSQGELFATTSCSWCR